MLREHHKLIRGIHTILDFLCILAGWLGSYFILSLYGHSLYRFHTYFLPFFVFTITVIGNFFLIKFQPEDYLTGYVKVLREVFYTAIIGFLLVTFFLYFLKIHYLSRLYLLTSCGLSLSFLLIRNLTVTFFYRKIREKGLNFQHLLLVGDRHTLPPVINSIRTNRSLGQKIQAVILIGDNTIPDVCLGLNVYHGLESIPDILKSSIIDNALFTVYRQQPREIEKAMLECGVRGIKVWFKPDFIHEMIPPRVDYLANIPLFVFSLGPKYGIGLIIKRLFDIVAAALLLPLLALPMAVISLLVKSTPGPVFFVQKRVGLNGRYFMMPKFRTMYKYSEQSRAEYNLKNEMHGPVFKMRNDPRITPIGRFLRKYSMDELPQLWSVLIGDMSLVGPRPPIPSEVELYSGWQRRRLSMCPGITCIWQVTGRNKITDFNEWARMDLKYIDEWSLFLDLKILLKTIPAVFGGTGV